MDTMNKTINLQLKGRIDDLRETLELYLSRTTTKPFIVVDKSNFNSAEVVRGQLQLLPTDYPSTWTWDEANNIRNELKRYYPYDVELDIIDPRVFYERRIKEYESILNLEQ